MVKCPIFATERLPQLREQAGGDKPLPYGRIAFAAEGTGLGTFGSAATPSGSFAASSLTRERWAVPFVTWYSRLPRRFAPRNDNPRTFVPPRNDNRVFPQ